MRPKALTPEQVKAIRQYYIDNKCPTHRHLAAKFKTSQQTITNVLKRRPPYAD